MMKPLDLSQEASWRKRFTVDVISWAVVAGQNPRRGIAASNRTGVVQIYAWEVDTGELRQVTDRERGTGGAVISADGRHIYYLDDERGNEIGHYVRVPFEGGAPQDITPDLPPYASFHFDECGSGHRLGFMSAGREGFVLYTAACDQAGEIGPWKGIWRGSAIAFGPIFTYDGDLVVVQSSEGTGKYEFSLEAYHTTTGELVGRLSEPGVSFEGRHFAPLSGDTRLLATSSASGYNRPFIWNPLSGERQEIALADLPGDIYNWSWSRDGRRVLLCQLHQARYQLLTVDLASGEVTRLDHPAGTLSGGAFADDGEIFVNWQDAANPPQQIALDGQTGRLTRVLLPPGDVPPGRPWRSVTFPSTGGIEIQGWLAVPEGAGPFPTILETHGGPTSVRPEIFNPSCQAWLDHRFAFLTINYRGSVTFGKAFEKAIWGNLGTVEIEDMAAARDWLVAEGIADLDQILLTGGSYGGYLTLQALGRRPELWAGGMATVAVADWVLMYEDQAETLRGYQRALFGGTPAEKPEAHRVASPITYAAQIAAPILVIQGRNDTRCPSRQMEKYEARLKELGKEIEVDWFDAGHGSMEDAQRIAFMERMLRFAYRVLG